MPAMCLEELRRAAVSNGAPAGDAADWSQGPLEKLVAHILAEHHAFMREVLPRIGLALPKVLRAHGARHGATIEPLNREFEGLCLEIEAHLLKEEQVLFPYIQALGAAAAGQGRSAGQPLRHGAQSHSPDGAGAHRGRPGAGERCAG